MTATPTTRVDALDATKGTLVVFMVIYHSLNYSTQYHLAFRYLSFLPPSFILITGFLLSSVYLARHAPTDFRLHARLLTRGAKLLALFTVLNLAAQFVHSRHYHNPTQGIGYFLDHWSEVYFHGDARLAVFEILLPIAYLLLLAPLLLVIAGIHRIALLVAAGGLLAACLVLDARGLSSTNFNLIAAGALGILLGQITFSQLAVLRRYVWLALAAYAAYAAAGAAWGQPFRLQLTGATIALAAIYGLALRLPSSGRLQPWLVRLGRYSLFSYVAQIGILQVLSHFTGRPAPASLGFLGLLLATLLLTSLAIAAVEWSRRRLRAVNGAYQAVFA